MLLDAADLSDNHWRRIEFQVSFNLVFKFRDLTAEMRDSSVPAGYLAVTLALVIVGTTRTDRRVASLGFNGPKSSAFYAAFVVVVYPPVEFHIFLFDATNTLV